MFKSYADNRTSVFYPVLQTDSVDNRDILFINIKNSSWVVQFIVLLYFYADRWLLVKFLQELLNQNETNLRR